MFKGLHFVNVLRDVSIYFFCQCERSWPEWLHVYWLKSNESVSLHVANLAFVSIIFRILNSSQSLNKIRKHIIENTRLEINYSNGSHFRSINCKSDSFWIPVKTLRMPMRMNMSFKFWNFNCQNWNDILSNFKFQSTKYSSFFVMAPTWFTSTLTLFKTHWNSFCSFKTNPHNHTTSLQ